MSDRDMPTMRSRRLGNELRRLREGASLNMGHAAAELMCGQPKISRIESGLRGIRPLDLEHLMTLYGLEDPVAREALQRLAKEIHKLDWWTSQGPLLHDTLKDYLTLEDDSDQIRTYTSHLFPGLLQTPAYMRAIFDQARPKSEPDVMVETRLKRQAILNDVERLDFRAALDIPVLHRVVGSPAVMAEQIEHVLEMAAQPNITIQVLPLSATLIPDEYGTYHLLTVRGTPPAQFAWLEYLTGSSVLEREAEVRRYRALWDDHTAVAHSPGDSLKILQDMLREYRQ